MYVYNVAMEEFVDSRSNGFRDIRGTDFLSNERTLAKLIPIALFRLKTLAKNKSAINKRAHQLARLGETSRCSFRYQTATVE